MTTRATRAPRCPRLAWDQRQIDRLAYLVDIADRYGLLPPSCLRRSLVLAWLLSDAGVPTTVKIGVAKNGAALTAHACVELTTPSVMRFFDEPEFADLLIPVVR